MTELDNVSLHLYDMSSKGIVVKKTILKFVWKLLNKINQKNKSQIKSKKLESKVLVLKDLNFFINKGDRIGLIGSNGSGKSTLLKLLSGIYKPSRGKIRGNVFFPMITRDLIVSHDLCGIDAVNAFYCQHNLHKINIAKKEFTKEIEENCNIGEYFNKPIKYYSEGMRTRLIFSLLTSVRLSENLAIDEGFGTGDKDFAKQAEKKLENFLGSDGSLLLASHSDDLLKQFCTRGLVLKSGRIVFDGDLNSALNFYNSNKY